MTDGNLLQRWWGVLRDLTGESAYDRYLQHWREHHAEAGGEPLSRRAFFAREQDRKWNGVKRCC